MYFFRCPVDPTVKFYNSPDNDGTSRFSITSFQFVDTESRAFYSHCSVLVCDKSDQSEQCNPPCQQQQQQRLALNAPIRSKRTRRSYKIVKTKDGILDLFVIHSFNLPFHLVFPPGGCKLHVAIRLFLGHKNAVY